MIGSYGVAFDWPDDSGALIGSRWAGGGVAGIEVDGVACFSDGGGSGDRMRGAFKIY